jgi:fibronectin type 3 domain-containing protein
LAYALYAGGNGPSPLGEITVGSNFDDASGSSSLPTDVWTHLAATYDGAALRLYVNGAMAASKAVVGALPSTADPLRIGGNGVWGEWFDGLIDEVRVYDRALTAAEIGTDMQRPVGGSSGGNVDTTPPTAPTGLSMTVTGSTVKLAWAAASDDVGVDHYNLYRSTSPGFTPAAANRIAEPTTTGYSDVGLAAGSYFYKLTAVDAAGNESTPSDQATATVDAQTTTGGLVAAYGMDAGSGTTLVDQSGNHNNGTLSNATWSASGKFGKALSFDGTNAFVSVPDSNSLDATSGLTVEGWAKPDGSTGFRALAVKETSGNIVYGLYANSDSNRPQSQVSTTNPLKLLDGTGTLPANTWSHVAFTYDGTTERLYVNGTQVESVAVSGAINTSTGALKIGGDAIWGEWFSGLIDEVRVYNRALSVAEIGQDMNTSISAPDSTPPSATGTLTATGGLGQVSLSWGAATDNTGVVKYDVYRSTTQGFTPSASNRIAQPTGLIYTDTGLTAGTTYYYRVTAEDAATNVGPATNEANATPTADTTPPTAPGSLTATGGAGKVTLSWNASTDAGGIARYNVHRGTTSGFTPTTANRIAQPTTTSYVDNGLSAGTYYYKVTADDNAGNTSAPSNEANATVGAAPPAGLVAAYGMDAGSGTTLVDQSGNGNNGTISNATWSASGKFGSALSFNGTNASVTIPDSNSLDATTGLTIEGWVKPTTSGGGAFRTMAVKETSGNLVYGLYVNSDSNRPQSQVTVGAPKLLDGTSAVPTGSWTHLAMTFDGTTERLFVNGTQVSSVAIAGSIATSTGALKIGGNSIWGEWYGGLIDELRVYNRALSASEITADMNTSISSPDSTPPSAPGTLTATGGLGQVSLSWGAATDNTGVVRYDVYRSTTQGFTPSASNRIAQPTTLTYTDNTGLTAGTTYYYRVTAEDAATNVGPASNEASATPTADTTPPTAPGSLTATGVPRKVTLGWNASTDAGGIARYNVYRSTTSGFTPSAGNRIAQPTTTSYVDNGLAAGTYYYKVTADDSAGNTSAASNEANATVPNGPPVGLVAAYGMDAGSGTTLVDQSGNGNNGTISNAAWSSSGKFGSALSFNGTNAVVSVPDSDSLDLTSGLTVEGWVKPDGSTGFRTLLVKETGGNIVYGLYANSDTNRPQSQVSTSNPLKLLDGTGTLPADTWSHLAFTYDGTTERLYVNGTQVASMAVSGAINTSTGALKIGGDAIWGEWFSGLIDEVRVYNRALSAAEIGSDMAKGVTGA